MDYDEDQVGEEQESEVLLDDEKEIPSRDASPAIPNEESDLEAPTPSLSTSFHKDPDGVQSYLEYVKSLPYPCETVEEMDSRLRFIVRRIIDCVETKDYDVGLVQWSHRLENWIGLKAPMKREIRAKLTLLFYNLTTLPGLDPRTVELACNMTMLLIEPKKRIDIDDLVLPWRPLYEILEREMFPKKRSTGKTSIGSNLLNLAAEAQRFFPPHESTEMLATFLPKMNGTKPDMLLATQAFMIHFLPLSHPSDWLQASFKLWECFNSNLWDEQWFEVLSRLAELHINPKVSSPQRVHRLQKQSTSAPASTDRHKVEMEENQSDWNGIRKDVGIFTQDQWNFIMSKCLHSMGCPVGSTGKSNMFLSMASAGNQDQQVSQNAMTMVKPAEKLASLATLIVYSIFEDGPRHAMSGASTPAVINGHSSTYSAGSKALDSLAKFIQATESFFHPSNSGKWTLQLIVLVKCISSEFLKRWTAEQKAECKTPREWRLTSLIKREFVSTLRTVALLAIYAKDPISIMTAATTLRSLAVLNPETVLPSVLERVFPALENVIETHRLNTSLSVLTLLSPVLISRSITPFGGKYLAPLFDLIIPGIDLNDPAKTITTCMFIVQAVSSMGPIEDLTRSEIASKVGRKRSHSLTVDGDGSEQPPIDEDIVMSVAEAASEFSQILPRREEDHLLLQSTITFPDWMTRFFRAVFTLLENLPEPGKGGHVGGKVEDRMVSAIVASVDSVLRCLSPRLFDEALRLYCDHIATSARSNSAKAIGNMAGAFSHGNPDKALHAILPLCLRQIRAELENGAASNPSTSTAQPMAEDASFQYYCYILQGVLTMHAEAVLKYGDQIIDLFKFMVLRCKSERGYNHMGRSIAALVSSLCSVWPRDTFPVNTEEYLDPDFASRSHQCWGRLYDVGDVKVSWHVPSQAEINFVMQLLHEIIEPVISSLENHVNTRAQDKGVTAWANDFCRHCIILKFVIPEMASLIKLEESPEHPGAKATDSGDEHLPFIDDHFACKVFYCLTDPKDPRYAFVAALRSRIYVLLHMSIIKLKDNGADDAIDSVKMIISTTKALLIDYPVDRNDHGHVKKSYEFAKTVTRFSKHQKKHPRFVWVRRANLYHNSRLRLNSFYRQRSASDDLLIGDIADLCRSLYVSVRKSAQRALEALIPYFDGIRSLLLDNFLASLQPGVESDIMKGALHVLGQKFFSNFAVLDWRYAPRYILALLHCQHQEKPSIQTLVKSVCTDFIVRLVEPSALEGSLESSALDLSILYLSKIVPPSSDAYMLQAVRQKRLDRSKRREENCNELVKELLIIANDARTHWRYQTLAARFLRALVRRDQPLDPAVATFFATQVISELPSVRGHAQLSLTKMLHFLKLRTFAREPAELVLRKVKNPLIDHLQLPDPPPADFTEQFLHSLTLPLSAPDTRLVDKQSTGWLIWDSQIEVYRAPPRDEAPFQWEKKSEEAVQAVRDILGNAEWWSTLNKHFSQEQTRAYLAADNTVLFKSVFQIFTDEFLHLVKPTIESQIMDGDRHKQRAASELLAGVLRGSKHWSLAKQQALHQWVAKLLPGIVKAITPDSQDALEMLFEYVLTNRDPRRNKFIIDFLTGLPIDLESSEAFSEAKKAYLISVASRSLSWHFEPWSQKYLDSYWQAVDNPFQELRLAVSENLKAISELRLHPSFGSTEEFLKTCNDPRTSSLLLDVDDDYRQRIQTFKIKLAHWRSIRQPASTGSQQYDTASLCVLGWIFAACNGVRITTLFPFVTTLLPELFQMQELSDNPELKQVAQAVIAAIANVPYPVSLVRPIMAALIDLLKTSTSWRIRLDVLPILQVFFFHQLFAISEDQVQELMDTLCFMLRDSSLEVREAAATSLSGIVRCSQRKAVLYLKKQFLEVVHQHKIPRRRNTKGEENPKYQKTLVEAHAGVLGASALIRAHPYDVPSWLPSLLLEVMGMHITSPAPVSTTVKQCLADFKKSHQDSWVEDQKAFTEDQLVQLNDLLISPSSYLV